VPPPPATPVWKRWWFWLAVSPALCCLSGVAIGGYARLTLSSNPVYIAALKRTNASGEAKLRLGSPIRCTGVNGFRLSLSGDSMLLDIEGPKGTGKLLAVAEGQEADSLQIFKMRIRVDSTGEIIPLDGMGRGSSEDF
jgi:hypothetical protein